VPAAPKHAVRPLVKRDVALTPPADRARIDAARIGL